MTRWNQEANSIFIEALELDDEAKRSEFVATQCNGNQELANEVQQLLHAHRASEGFLESSARETLGVGDAPSVRMSDSGLPSAAKSLAPGTMVGRYRIDETLGSGGMGIVFLATDTRLNRQVAIKIPRGDMHRDIEARFEREARTMAAISHPNLAKILDLDRYNDHTILIMEYVAGDILSDSISTTTQRDNASIAKLMHKLSSATACAHQAGIIHRDIKPGNIIMRPDGEPVLMDFGLAYAESDDARVTRAGTIMGTPAYMAPEQLLTSEHPVGPLSDVYALGAICYELLTGTTVYEGTASEVLSSLASNKPIVSPKQRNANADPWLEAICLKALERIPHDRFESSQQLADAFAYYLSDDQMTLARLLKTSARKANSSGNWFTRNWTWVAAASAAFVFLFGTFIIQTNNGQFVLETDSPDIAARLAKDGGIVVENRITKTSYTLHRGTNTLPNGDYDLVVTSPDGLDVTTPKFQIKRLGGPVIASVIVRPNDATKNALSELVKIKTLNEVMPTLLPNLPADLASHPLISPDWKWSEPENLGRAIYPDGPMHECFISDDELTLIFRSGMSTRMATREHRDRPFASTSALVQDNYLFFATLSSDQLQLLCCGPRDNGHGGFDLFQWTRPTINEPWSPRDWEHDYLNSEENDGQAWLSSDGLEVYFCSTRTGTVGSDDLYVAKRSNREEKFGEPIRLNESMNSQSQDFSPCLTADDRILLFNSGRKTGLGKMDIYMSIRKSRDEMFTMPILLGPEVNGPYSEGRPILSADGTTLYFDSDRPGGNRNSDFWCIRRVRK